jgi:hypothetical protein
MFGRRKTGLAFAAFFLCALALHAVAPNFASISPAGGQRGTTVDVTLRGERLADVQEVFFYRPGIAVARIVEATDKQVKLALNVAPDCELGEHPLRLRTASGVSALRIFYVGPFPNVDEKEPNNTPAKPQSVTLNTTVNGMLGSEDVDVFAVDAKHGQRFSAEVEGARLGRTMLDPILTIRDASGRVLAENDDTPLLGHDSYASILAPADGRYTIEVRDVTYGGNGHVYRLHVGTFPRPAVVFPLGGRAGEALALNFIGDPTGDFTETIALPKERSGTFGVTAQHDGIAPSPNWLRVVDAPNAPLVSAAATLAQAPLIETRVPFAFNGVLAKKGDAAFFRFAAKKDQQLDVQVFARRLGSPLDSVVTVLDAKGASLGTNDDAAGNPDSTVRVKIPADGNYAVKVADMLGRGGERFVYRVEITDVQPTAVLSIPDTARYDYETRKSIVVPRGNRCAVLMNVARDAFNGELKLAFDGLPAGITAASEPLPGSVSAVPVVFEAAADAPIAGALLTPTASAVEADKVPKLASRFRHTVDWVRIQNDTMYSRTEVDRIAAAVVEEVPFKVRILEPHVPLVQSGEMDLQIVAERAAGFEEPITLKMLWNPPGVSALPDITLPKDATTISYKLNATNKAELRTWKIAVVAGATEKGGTAYVSSQLAPLEIAPPFLSGKMDLAKVERGQKAKLVCALEQKVAFEGKATARLVGLPDGVTAAEVEITKESKEAAFEVVTTDKSPTGLFKNISCKVVVTQAAEPITQVIAPGSVLRIDAPRAKEVAATMPAKR